MEELFFALDHREGVGEEWQYKLTDYHLSH